LNSVLTTNNFARYAYDDLFPSAANLLSVDLLCFHPVEAGDLGKPTPELKD